MTHLDELGPFFGIATHTADQRMPPPWMSFAEALNDDSGVLDGRVSRVRAALAAGTDIVVESRVAASVTHLGLVARIIAPTIGAHTLGEIRYSQSPTDLWWCDELGGPFPLSMTPARPPADAVEGRPETGPGDTVTALTTAVGDRFGVSARTLWGNVASAVNSAALLVGAAWPEHAGRARELADQLLADPRIEDGALRAGPEFRRRSCCLIYRVTGDRTAVCGDCVLT